MLDLWSFPVAFYFDVQMLGISLRFYEVSGLNQQIELVHLSEGGGVGYDVPKEVKHGNLILKRAINPIVRDVFDEWVSMTFASVKKVSPMDLTISLLDSDGNKQCIWYISEAYPVKWDVGNFSAKSGELVMETTELAFHEITRVL
ncbi:MAG: phage tail protein [Paludibacteraceae bacterium]|nr:phage tail protein [Paludibacteraceae bacterium]MBR5972609.1 phage tail protein [Paludibacteraceae bacterium]